MPKPNMQGLGELFSDKDIEKYSLDQYSKTYDFTDEDFDKVKALANDFIDMQLVQYSNVGKKQLIEEDPAACFYEKESNLAKSKIAEEMSSLSSEMQSLRTEQKSKIEAKMGVLQTAACYMDTLKMAEFAGKGIKLFTSQELYSTDVNSSSKPEIDYNPQFAEIMKQRRAPYYAFKMLDENTALDGVMREKRDPLCKMALILAKNKFEEDAKKFIEPFPNIAENADILAEKESEITDAEEKSQRAKLLASCAREDLKFAAPAEKGICQRIWESITEFFEKLFGMNKDKQASAEVKEEVKVEDLVAEESGKLPKINGKPEISEEKEIKAPSL